MARRGRLKEWSGGALSGIEMEALLMVRKFRLYLMDQGQKFVRFWQLLDVLGFVALMTCCLSVVTRGGHLQDEKGPVLLSEGSGRRLDRQESWGRPCST